MSEPDIARRGFLQKLLVGVFGITAISFVLPVTEYLLPKKEKGGANLLTDVDGKPILGSDIKEDDSIVGFSKSGPTIVVRRGNKLHAFSAVCTHLGCIVKWVPTENIFFCPCHAGKFDANGANISGPPPEPLAVYNTEIDKDGRIILEKA